MAIPSEKVTYFAETDARNQRVPFGIKAKDRLKHVYVIGKTGMGKSTLLENMAVQDIQSGEGMAFIDPHGKTAELLLEYVPEERIKDVIYFAPFDTEYPISFNVMEDVGPDKRHLVANGLMSAFKKLFGEESFSDRMQYILQNTILALLEYPNSTMLGINKMLVDKEYRKKVVDNVTDPSVKTYWTQEFAGYTERFAAEAIPAIQNKIGQFTSNPLVRNIIGQEHSSFDFRKVMDERKILIINLSKGRVGEANANLLGSMIITKIYLAAMSRADTSEAELQKLPNFYLYVDEFQSFANESFADILSEARKYKLNLTIAHQYIEQMDEAVRAAVFGNVGTMIVFRVGAYDAEVLEKEFAPTFTVEDLVNLGSFQIYLKLMIDGVSSQPFSAVTLPPIDKPESSFVKDIVEHSRKAFATPKAVVEGRIRDWHETDKGERSAPGRRPMGETLGRKPMGETLGRKPMGETLGRKPMGETEKKNSSVRNERTLSPQPIDIRGKKPTRKEVPPMPEDPDFKPLQSLTHRPMSEGVSLNELQKRNDNQRVPTQKNMADLRQALTAIVGSQSQTKPKEESKSFDATPRSKPKDQPKPEASSKQPEARNGPSPEELKKILDVQ